MNIRGFKLALSDWLKGLFESGNLILGGKVKNIRKNLARIYKITTFATQNKKEMRK